MWQMIAGLLILLLAAAADIRKMEIPLWVFAGAGVMSAVSLILQAVNGASPGMILPAALLAVLPGGVLISIGFLSRGGIGYGDGILALLIGPVFGLHVMAGGICLAFFLSALAGAGLMIARRAGRKTRLPFVPFLLLGMGVICYVSEMVIHE